MNVIKQAGSDLKQNAKAVARKMAQQALQEPFEILKTATRQIEGIPNQEAQQQDAPQPEEKKGPTPEEEAQKKAQEQRLMQAFSAEMDQIRKQNLFKDLQTKIANGEQVPLNDYPELTAEEKQALMAQAEAVKAQKAAQVQSQSETIPQIVSRKGRKMFGGVGLKREQTKTETRQPPSS